MLKLIEVKVELLDDIEEAINKEGVDAEDVRGIQYEYSNYDDSKSEGQIKIFRPQSTYDVKVWYISKDK